MRVAFVAVSVALSFGCATKSLPPGTPPPEYEQRSFEPWPKEATDAGNEASAPEPAATSEPLPPSVVSVPSDGDAGLADAPR